jgi:hypothetical protein
VCGINNTAVGLRSLESNTGGTCNTAIGFNSLRQNTDGANNTAVGSRALFANTTGGLNSAVGFYSLRYNTTGTCNTALGYRSLYANLTGCSNTAVGSRALCQKIQSKSQGRRIKSGENCCYIAKMFHTKPNLNLIIAVTCGAPAANPANDTGMTGADLLAAAGLRRTR